jgi:hypothetical protein
MLDDEQPEQIGFKGFVARLNPQQADKLFGASNVKLWRAGKLTDAQMVRQQGRSLSIDKLRQRTEDKGDTQTEFPYL